MNNSGHIEFAMMLWLFVIMGFTSAIISGSVFSIIMWILFLLLACTQPYFLMAPFAIIGFIGYSIIEGFKKLKKVFSKKEIT